MQTPIVQGQITVEFARSWAKWKLWVRKHYSHQFVWVKEGDTVRMPGGKTGKLTLHNYHPESNTHLLEVTSGSKLQYFDCPYQLETIRGS